MPGKEKQIELEIRKYLEFDLKAYVIKIHGNAFQKPGIPDLISCVNGHFIGIEVKQEKGRISPQQEIHISKIRKSNGLAIVARSLDDLKKFLKDENIIK